MPLYRGIYRLKLEEVLVVNSKYDRQLLKRRLIEKGIWKEVCSACGLGPKWNSNWLCLHVDHINGVPTDHRLENLRLLCPNCHSQTETYCKKWIPERKSGNCLDCNELIFPPSIRCSDCSIEHCKVKWPEQEILEKLFETKTIDEIAKIVGCSRRSVSRKKKSLTNPKKRLQ